mgnify:CR=1 FL=1
MVAAAAVGVAALLVVLAAEVAAAGRCRHSTIVAIDFGTTGTSYAILYPDKSVVGDMVALAREVQTYSTDESAHSSNKARTAVLLDPADGNKLLAFGGAALKQFHEMAEQYEPPLAVLYTDFKMVLEPGVSADPASLLVIGASTWREGPPPAPVPLLLVIQRMLEAVAKAARDRMVAQWGEALAATMPVFWVVTVPAIWDARGKACMRRAAVAAGLVPSVDAPNLLLALEPVCALLAAIAEAAPAVSESLDGKSVMILDCGGSSVDITVEKVSLRPLVLSEVATLQSGPWGAREVDRQMRGFLTMVLGVEAMAKVDASSLMTLMDRWESDKMLVGKEDSDAGGDADEVKLRMGDIMDAAGLSMDDIHALVQAFNRRAGCEVLTVGARKTLKLHGKVVRSFFVPVTRKITTCLRDTLSLHRADYVLLVGGFGSSPYLLREVQEAVREVGATDVVWPVRPGTAVVSGAALYALQPATAMPYTVSNMRPEADGPETHPECARASTPDSRASTPDGRAMARTLVPVAQVGDRVGAHDHEVGCTVPSTVDCIRPAECAPALHAECAGVMAPDGRAMSRILMPMARVGAHDHFTQTSLRPPTEDTTTIPIKLYRAPRLDAAEEPTGRRTVVVSGAAAAAAATATTAASVPSATDAALIGTLPVPVLDMDAPFDQRTMSLTVSFSQTELEATVVSRRGRTCVMTMPLPPPCVYYFAC